MDLATAPRRSRRRSSWGRVFTLSFIFLLSIGLIIYYLWDRHSPNTEHAPPDFHHIAKPIFYQGKIMEITALGAKESLKLPLTVVEDIIDPAIHYEKDSESIIITTHDKVVRLRTDQLTAMMNEKPFTMTFPVDKEGETVYLPIEALKEFYHIHIKESPDTGVVFLQKEGDVIQWGQVLPLKKPEDTVPMRLNPTDQAPIVADLPQSEKLMIWAEENGWYTVQLDNGYMGYVEKNSISLDHLEVISVEKKLAAYVPWKPVGGKVNLTWKQVYNKNPDTSKLPQMPGLNVFSPTWFHLADDAGNIRNMADASVVQWAHQREYQVWALFDNGFNPDWTTAVLSSYDKRMHMIQQLLGFAQMYQLQGINIDFENVYTKDKANLVQFVREMAPLMHEQGLVVSMDVNTKSKSEMWSMFLDHAALSVPLDYMIIMTYDQHAASSPVAGSVAALPWVENGLLRIMQEDQVPASKIMLGIPYYTRIWTEQTKDGKIEVSSKAVGMDAVQQIIKEKKLTPVFSEETGQNYVEYIEDGSKKKIWIEDAKSVQARIELVKKYDLAGVASWSQGFESSDIWGVVKETLERRP